MSRIPNNLLSNYVLREMVNAKLDVPLAPGTSRDALIQWATAMWGGSVDSMEAAAVARKRLDRSHS